MDWLSNKLAVIFNQKSRVMFNSFLPDWILKHHRCTLDKTAFLKQAATFFLAKIWDRIVFLTQGRLHCDGKKMHSKGENEPREMLIINISISKLRSIDKNSLKWVIFAQYFIVLCILSSLKLA